MLGCFCLAAALWSVTAGATALADVPQNIWIGKLQELEDTTAASTLDQIVQQRERFRDVTAKTPSHGFSSSAFWLRLPIENLRDRPIRRFLVVEHTTLDHVDLYVVGPAGRRDVSHTGDRVALRERPYPAGMLVLPFELAAGEAAELYVRVRADAASMVIPLEIMDETELRASLKLRHVLHGAILGLFVALFVYNLFIYTLLRDRVYLYYVIYLPFSFLALSALNGSGAELLYPSATWPGNEGLLVFSGLSFFLMLSFTRTFLHTYENSRIDQAVRLLMLVSIALAASPLLLPIKTGYELGVVEIFAFPALCSVIGITAWWRGRTEARFYVFGQMASWIGLMLFGLMTAGVLPFHFVFFEAVPLGLSVDTLMLALALADRIRILQAAKRLAEDTVRKNLEIRQEELEQLVAERTAALESARQEAERLATTDPLTRIYNRRGMLLPAEREVQLALRNSRPLSAIMFDLDHFKRINDKHGHAEGDRVLREVTAVVRETIRATDLFGRVGGEEFLLLLPDTPLGSTLQVAERIRSGVAQNVTVGTPPEPVTVSLGAAFLDGQSIAGLDSLQSAADHALYRAKNGGRNRVEPFSPRLFKVGEKG